MRFATFLALIFGSIAAGSAMSSEAIRCSCQFEQSSGYEAVGTRAACSTMTRKSPTGKGAKCEVSFGGTSADEPLVSKLTGVKPEEYRRVAVEATMRSLEAWRTQRLEIVSDPDYLRGAIPLFLRGTYLRQSAGLDEQTRASIDREVVQIAEKWAGPIAEVFLQKRQPFEEKVGDNSVLSVERGAIRIVYRAEIALVVVFFEPPVAR